MGLNPTYDIRFDCSTNGYLDVGVLLEGGLEGVFIFDSTFDLNTLLEGEFKSPIIFSGTFNLGALLHDIDIYITGSKSNWVKWSTIGAFNFALDRYNLAGEMPIGWAGDIYKLGQLHEKIVVYGSGGISILQAHDNVFSKRLSLSIGVKSKGSILCEPDFHLFIDSTGCLWKLQDTFHKFGYEEFLSVLTNPIISYDRLSKLAYICDGTIGFVFSVEDASLSKGPNNVTSIGFYAGVSHICSSGAVTIPSKTITFQNTDFYNRNFKTITEVEIGGEFDSTLVVGISYRNNSGTFSSPVYFSVTSEGRAFPNFFAKDFKFSLVATSITNLDYIKFKGIFADYNPIDVEN